MSYLPKLLIAAALFVVTPMTTNADLRVSARDSESDTTRYVSDQRRWRGDRHHRRHRHRNYYRGYYYSQPYRYHYRTPRYYYYYDSPYYYDYYYYPRGSVGVGPLQFYWH